MMGLIGKKIGMTQLFDEKGDIVPVTVIEAGPCTVTEIRTGERDGYTALQLGFGTNKESRFSKPVLGQFKKRNLPLSRHLREFCLGDVAETELPEVPGQRQVALLELPQHRLREPALLVRAEPELERGVAVALPGADLRDGARSRFDHGHRDDVALLVEELRHPDLLADEPHHCVSILSRRRTHWVPSLPARVPRGPPEWQYP